MSCTIPVGEMFRNGRPCVTSVTALTVLPSAGGSGQKYEEENGKFYLTAGGEPEENDSNKENPDMDVNDILRMFFKS